MNRRQMVVMMAAGGAVVAYGANGINRSATAGGWASLELLNPVQLAVVGVPVTIDAQVLAHGERPSAWATAGMRLIDDATGDVQAVRLTQISERHALVHGEVTLDTAGTWRMVTDDMGVEIEVGRLLAVDPAEGDVISQLRPAPGSAVACAGGDTAAAVETEILYGSFADPLLEVAVGTTVRWVNTSSITHQVAFADPALASSPMLHEGAAFSATFDTPGTYDYVCPPHPGMAGTVRVG